MHFSYVIYIITIDSWFLGCQEPPYAMTKMVHVSNGILFESDHYITA